MKGKHRLLLLIVALFGQAVIALFYDSFTNVLPIFFMLVVVIIKISGDMLSKFVFKFPGYNWIYLRDYLLHDLLVALGYYLIFALMWSVVLVVANPALITDADKLSYASAGLMFKILSSSIWPTLFYGFFQSKKTQVTETSKKRMRKKI